MYTDRSLCGDPKKDKLIGELNFKNCMCLNRKTTSKLFFGITYKKINFIIHPEYLMPKISSHIHLFRISNINKTWFRTYSEK